MRTVLALALMTSPAMAQNSFPTPGNASVPGILLMCLVNGRAVPCSGTVTGDDSSFTTPGNSQVGGGVRMCIINNQAVPC